MFEVPKLNVVEALLLLTEVELNVVAIVGNAKEEDGNNSRRIHDMVVILLLINIVLETKLPTCRLLVLVECDVHCDGIVIFPVAIEVGMFCN